ncbi:hypothetical protein [uncultured Shewanella sp.]|uniref:hypothetical protein n=1 Tax=uncultured Shewanella sp. TaxID=173975 RepID=UPI00260BC5A6|nr:hypothetical protein [uncultured Shewanella sp.]
MISLRFSVIDLSPDLKVKQAAAVEQMQSLFDRLQVTPQYHTLTMSDRLLLKKEGYADDLTNNLVVMTQRNNTPNTKVKDKLNIGFTYAAFDPALYACDTLLLHLKQLSQGCCAYCESFLGATEAGGVSHFRPVTLIDNTYQDRDKPLSSHVTEPSPYFALGYQQDNLVYTCRACDEHYKAGLFPVRGARFPECSVLEEDALLINPYDEEPRAYIRFNPVSAKAYAYDGVKQFYQSQFQLTEREVECLLWSEPDMIPDTHTGDTASNCSRALSQAYHDWLNRLHANERPRGQVMIDTLGLNRRALVLARIEALNQYRLLFDGLSVQGRDVPYEVSDMRAIAYRSLGVDAFNTWALSRALKQELKQELKQASSSEHSTFLQAGIVCLQQTHIRELKTQFLSATASATTSGFQKPTQHAVGTQSISIKSDPLQPIFSFPPWFRSCLRYFVSESAINETAKRQLVFLSGKDGIYGLQAKEKCVFLPINWHKDSQCIIKVHSHRNIWETSFSELAASRPLELVNLFANNQLWVAGDFSALITH